jgi:hypothetical protein
MMSERIGVKCTFQVDGRVRVRQIEYRGEWLAVGQGRQWHDQEGRHVLVQMPDDQLREVVLRKDVGWWEIRPIRSHIGIV